LRSSSRKLKPLPPDPFRHQDSVIALSENASDTEPASLLAVFVADIGVVLTTPVQAH
jgi:hypothetical protein